MGLDDIVDDAKDGKEEEKAEELADKLGIENVEELEELDERISSMYELLMKIDSRMEEIEQKLEINQRAISDISNNQQENEDEEEDITDWSDLG